uniref:Uncharacterized protein n=1 Tax=Entomoneis paludosa TaxID=265537 RepID=A0A7S2YJT7_9STRA
MAPPPKEEEATFTQEHAKEEDAQERIALIPVQHLSLSTNHRQESSKSIYTETSSHHDPTGEELLKELAEIQHPSSSSLFFSSMNTESTASTQDTSLSGDGGSVVSSRNQSQGSKNRKLTKDHNTQPQPSDARKDSKSDSQNSIKLIVLLVLCLQNSLFTVLRRYSHGVLQESASKYEVLLLGEVIKILFSACMIKGTVREGNSMMDLSKHLIFITSNSGKMVVLALIYGVMNILSFVSLRNIGAGMFTIFAQCKILTTATFSTFLLGRQYSATKWRALIGLMFGVLLFSEPIWGEELRHFSETGSFGAYETNSHQRLQRVIGIIAVLTEVTLSGFASIYFEKVIKNDSLQMNIWERNFQLALSSFPVYLLFIAADQGGAAGQIGGGWSWITVIVSLLGAAGGLLVALSIKYGDAILKTLATTGAIVLSSVLDHLFLGGPLTPVMMIAGVQVILAIFDYTFDKTPSIQESQSKPLEQMAPEKEEKKRRTTSVEMKSSVRRSISGPVAVRRNLSGFSRSLASPPFDEEAGLVRPSRK